MLVPQKSLCILRNSNKLHFPLVQKFVLLMDEISLKKHLFYDISKDTLNGTEDYGDYNSSGLLANSALVLMVRGILHNWKQTVAYLSC